MASLSIEDQIILRQFYDNGVNKRQAAIHSGVSEPTVYRYYAKWDALMALGNSQEVFRFSDLNPNILKEFDIQARMRCMTLYNFTLLLLTTITKDNLFKSILDIDEDNPLKDRLTKHAQS